MSLIEPIIVQPLTGETNEIHLSRPLYESWKLASFSNLTLKCGPVQHSVSCLPNNNGGSPQLICDPRLLQKFHLPVEPQPLRIAFDPTKGELQIGPVVAVLTLLKGNAFEGSLVAYCDELTRYSEKQHALLYVFTLKDWRRDSVIGYVKRHNYWDRRELPIPHVIHNRIGQRKLEQLPATERYFQEITNEGIACFNARFLDKWEVHQQLASHPDLAPYLPETILYESEKSLKEMTERYSSVFLKPAAGSQGKQIFRITRRENHFELDYTTFSGDIERQFSTFEELYHTLVRRIRQQQYIIQQGLSLLEHRQCPLDFRMLCNRRQTDKWTVTSGVARISNEEQFVSNLARGGKSHSIKEVLQQAFPNRVAKQIRALLGDLSLEIAERVSLESEGIYGELGIDLALDYQGKPWILEVNTKPSKDLDPSRDQAIRPSAKAVIDYSCYLAGFSNP
ncbi:MAG TPA: YheC/YheD family protein [Bacillales bacterium]|nr:YheC/YheD family protein [Bacillales bacterium]